MSDINPVEFGRVIGHLEAIQSELRDLKTRTVWRLDNLEGRVEMLETKGAEQAPYWRLIERAIVVLVALGTAAWAGGKFFGVV